MQAAGLPLGAPAAMPVALPSAMPPLSVAAPALMQHYQALQVPSALPGGGFLPMAALPGAGAVQQAAQRAVGSAPSRSLMEQGGSGALPAAAPALQRGQAGAGSGPCSQPNTRHYLLAMHPHPPPM